MRVIIMLLCSKFSLFIVYKVVTHEMLDRNPPNVEFVMNDI